MSQTLSLATNEACNHEFPRVSENRRYMEDPRNGGIYVHHQIVMSIDDWARCPESREEGWEVTHHGMLVIAFKITFLMGMKLKEERRGGG